MDFTFSEEDTNTPTPPPGEESNESLLLNSVPNYLLAADSHNALAQKPSILDPSQWSVDIANTGKFAAATGIAALTSIGNVAVTLGNWFGGDIEKFKTQDVIQGLDDDLSLYYKHNQEGIDITGDILASFVPGTAGIKALNWGQRVLRVAESSGILGANFSRVTGLLAPNIGKYTEAAVASLAESGSVFKLTEVNTLKALAAGAGQAALESAAFETAVQLTMHQSPILEGQDYKDIAINIGWGTLFGTGFGAAFSSAKTLGAIRKGITGADAAAFPFQHITETPAGTSSFEKILWWKNDINSIPVPEGDRAAQFAGFAKVKTDKIENLIRLEFQKMVGGDTDVANALADSMRGMSQEDVFNNIMHLQEAGRLSVKTGAEKLLGKDATTLSAEELAAVGRTQVHTLKLWGEDAGSVLATPPIVTSVADTLGKNETLTVVKNSLKSTSGETIYRLDPKKLWDASQAKNYIEAESRYITALHSEKLDDGIVIHKYDIPLLEKAYREGTKDVKIQMENGPIEHPSWDTPADKLKFIDNTKREVADLVVKNSGIGADPEAVEVKLKQLIAANFGPGEVPTPEDLLELRLRAHQLNTEEVSKLVNAQPGWLDRSSLGDYTDGMFALQTAAKKDVARRVASGLLKNPEAETTPAYFKPQHIKLAYNIDAFRDVNGHVLEGMSYLKSKQKLYQQTIDNVFAHETGERANTFTDLTDEDITRSNRLGTGIGFASSPNGNYGTISSKTESIGVATQALKKSRVDAMNDRLQSAQYALRNNEDAKLEFAVISHQLRSTPEAYALTENGTLKVRKLIDYEEAVANGETVPPPNVTKSSIPDEIEIKNQEVRDWLQAHTDVNDARLSTLKNIRGAQSLASNLQPGNVYIPPPNPKKFPHFAFVIDESVTSTGHVSMLHAATEDQLAAMVQKVRTEFPEFTVATKAEQDLFHKAHGDYQYDLGLNENYIDTAMKRKGISSFLPRTDGDKLLDEHIEWHVRQEQSVAQDLVSLKYSKQLAELRRLGEQFTDIATSRYTGTGKSAISEVKNPYEDYVRTMLDVSKASEFPIWTPLNRLLETSVSKLSSSIGNLWSGVKSTADLTQINSALQKAGIKSAYYDAATELLANHSAPKPVLSDFILKASGILSTLVLRSDPLNALNNGIGQTVLLGAETSNVLKKIAQSDSDAVGKLAQLGTVAVPGTGDTIRSPAKVIAQAYQDWWKSTAGDELHTRYQQNGWLTSITDQLKSTVEHLVLKGNETPYELQSKLQKSFTVMKGLGDTAEKWSGNKITEEMNRFVNARVMDLITQPAVEAGIMTDKEAISYINTFVSRVQGSRIASQRPVMFTGPIGHSISLFQTYQLNMMQQLFRYVADGGTKDAAMLLGLQGTVYGMNGLPAFNAINTHLIGNAAGNRNHTDITSQTYDTVGKEAGDWLLYGAASNIFLHPDLKVNLYSRGDINPRNVSIIPINPLDTPIVAGAAKFFGSIKDTVEKIAQGGNIWQSVLQGIEHNGVSRPLSGLAQTLEAIGNNGKAYSTDAKGSIVNQNDFLSLTTLGRLAGGKPLDEAIAQDAVFRIGAYKAKDLADVKELGAAVRTAVIQNQDVDDGKLDTFLQNYAKAGGKQQNFNRFMLQQYKQANQSAANKLYEGLKNPFSKNMQQVMGGYELDDFSN